MVSRLLSAIAVSSYKYVHCYICQGTFILLFILLFVFIFNVFIQHKAVPGQLQICSRSLWIFVTGKVRVVRPRKPAAPYETSEKRSPVSKISSVCCLMSTVSCLECKHMLCHVLLTDGCHQSHTM